MSDDEQVPDLLASLDQLVAGLRARAFLLGGYMRGLLDAGFTRDEALAIVIEYQTVLDQADTDE
jgi:hypothetical protein